jgi:hypothetical protein
MCPKKRINMRERERERKRERAREKEKERERERSITRRLVVDYVSLQFHSLKEE